MTTSGIMTRVLGLVLVVEDDADDREALTELLTAHGFDVVAAADVAGAVAHLQTCVPDVVLTDLQLADRSSGVDLAQIVRRTSAISHVGLIATSGAVEPTWPTVRHFDAYLRKPLEAKAVIDLITQLRDAARKLQAHPPYAPADTPSGTAER